jgi:hypothetical protein
MVPMSCNQHMLHSLGGSDNKYVFVIQAVQYSSAIQHTEHVPGTPNIRVHVSQRGSRLETPETVSTT